jgi:hypothetical protein
VEGCITYVLPTFLCVGGGDDIVLVEFRSTRRKQSAFFKLCLRYTFNLNTDRTEEAGAATEFGCPPGLLLLLLLYGPPKLPRCLPQVPRNG